MAPLPDRHPLPLPAELHHQVHDPRLTAAGLLYETHAGVRTQVEPELEVHGITPSSFEVLLRLARAPGGRLRMSDLAVECTLSNSGLTRVIDRMEAHGCVERLQDPADRRVIHAVLTDEGVATLARVLPGHLATIDRSITSVLDADELDALIRALAKIRAVVKPAAAAPPAAALPA